MARRSAAEHPGRRKWPRLYGLSGKDHRHVLACFDLADGSEIWQQPVNGEIITSPVLADAHVYLTCLDGTLFGFEQRDGAPLWSESKDASSSPAVWRKNCYFSQRGKWRATGSDGPDQMGEPGE